MSMTSCDDLRAAGYNASVQRQPGADSLSNTLPRSKRTEHILTALSVVMWYVPMKLKHKLRFDALHQSWSTLAVELSCDQACPVVH